ncbi:uncharacterized protein LOC129598235 isoform X2 [Paramacrobiotus metropolitanus]|uniref:uncharacterized protein LOC129598235 isoform X2 n=1 Tax=Paramacrobiotus metropolitanus TaxID=2943436 RepID=UPI002445F699|nr:uncharacterized protein LOC129598235 isoform X2 [Paramacrobiotus metropolitanus]
MMNCYGGDLASVLKKATENGALTDNYGKVIRYAKDITRGLAFLHYYGIIHGDQKPGNILVKGSSENSEWLLIGDLDDLVQMQESATCSGDISQLRGTTRYMSPDMLKKFAKLLTEAPGRKTDVWSLGCIILELVECVQGIHEKQLISEGQTVVIGKDVSGYQFGKMIIERYAPFVNGGIPKVLAHYIRQCLRLDVKRRICAECLLNELQYYKLIAFVRYEVHEIPKIVIFDPLTNTVRAHRECHITPLQPLSSPTIAATGREVMFYTVCRKLHFWNVGDKTVRELETSFELRSSFECPVVVNKFLYYWDGARYFMEADIVTGSKKPLEINPAAQNRFGSHRGAVAKYGNKIFYTANFKKQSTCLECYDTVTGEWKPLPDIPGKRIWFAMAVVDGHVYIVGGQNSCKSTASPTGTSTATSAGMRLNLDTATWQDIPALRQPRYDHSACVINKQIYVCGGRNSAKEHASTVEVYDTRRGEAWAIVSLSPKDQELLQRLANGSSGVLTATPVDR